MKKWLLLFLVPVFIYSSCKKAGSSGCEATAPDGVASASETTYLQNYLLAQGLTAASTHGMFYRINTIGSGAAPNLCSSITVTYTGTLITGTTDGPQFDASATPVSFTLDQLIAGWQLVLPFAHAGSQISLYIPPSLGYGSAGSGPVPPNSYLKFEITLVSVQ